MAESETTILPRDLVESQLSMIELLMAMYPPPESTEEGINSSLEGMLEKTRNWCESSEAPPGANCLPPSLDITVTVPVEDESSDASHSIQMSISAPLLSQEKDPTEPPPISYQVRQPPWMSRTELSKMVADMPVADVVSALEYVKENASQYFHRDDRCPENPQTASSKNDGPLLRVFFYFPSLSTREKRKDLVNYAPRYHLTGFVLAGKPGVLCLEGTSTNVDNYMNAIKNESWGDIPSHQKKVSERLREHCGEEGRKFEGMREITDDLGERRGTRKNRGDMAALEAFLTEQGVGASFSKVIMGV
ncbi:unnamed protein product [Discula destructiva]